MKKLLILVSLSLLLAACAKRTVIGPTVPSAREPDIVEEWTPTVEGGRRVLPVEVANLYLQGLMAYHHGQYQQALSKLTAVLNVEHSFSEAYWARGEIYYDLKKYDLALRNYHQALQYDPQLINAALKLAHLYMERRDYKDAQKQLQHILDLDSRQPMALELLEKGRQQAGRYYLKQGQALMQAGKRPQAIAALERALQSNPKLYPAWLELGRIQQDKGQIPEALRSYERALKVKADLPIVWEEIGKLYLQTAAYDKARHAFQRSLVLAPDQPEVQRLFREAQSNFYRLMDLPEEYLRISSNPSLSRGGLAAVLAVNLRSLPQVSDVASESTLIIPDIAGHWANQFINYTVKRSWMQPYPNHNFLPSQVVTRGELAAILDGILAGQTLPAQLKPLDNPIIFTDLSSEHQYYQAIMRAASLGLLAPYQKREGTFSPDRAVNGVEALEIIDRLVEYLDIRG